MGLYPIISLKRGREQVIERKHPWIFSRALYPTSEKIENGEIVEIQDFKGDFLAIGSFHKNNIALRILSFSPVEINRNFFIEKIGNAAELRRKLSLPCAETNCFRAIHGEGDGLSGLIVDIYNNTAVIQCHNLAIYKLKEEIADAILEVYQGIVFNIYNKSEKSLAGIHHKEPDGYIRLSTIDSPKEIAKENNLSFSIDWLTGQKTGFFLDQRDNRKLLGTYSEGKSVLNCFSYTGGFSLYGLRSGATQVTSVDVSERAINNLNKNLSLNNFDENAASITEDVMKYLKGQASGSWDIIVIDPPAFAKNVSKKHNAVIAYKRLNALALSKIKKGGLLFTFSCSQVVDTELFYNTITAASIESGRDIQVLHKMMQAPDHPVNIYHPEGSYLKGLVLYVN